MCISLLATRCTHSSIEPEMITASSTLGRTTSYSYEPYMAVDGKLNTAWCEGRGGDGINENLKISFRKNATVTSIGILNGFPDEHTSLGDLYYANNRVKDIRLEFKDGFEDFRLMDDVKSFQKLSFKTKHETAWVNVIIRAVYAGKKFQDTCIAEIKIYGNQDTTSTGKPESKKWVIEETHVSDFNRDEIILPRKHTKSECEAERSALEKEQRARSEKYFADCDKPSAFCGEMGRTEYKCIQKY